MQSPKKNNVANTAQLPELYILPNSCIKAGKKNKKQKKKKKKKKKKTLYITKTRLYNFDPLKPHFYIVKLWFTSVYIIFLNLRKKT